METGTDEDVWRHSADAWLRTVEQGITDSAPLTMAGPGTAEQFVLCSIRLWWHADSGEGACARVQVRNGFVAANLPKAAHRCFEQFMLVLAAAARPRPIINAPTQLIVSEDEARLRSAIALCQEAHHGHAIMVLKRWLPATAYRVSLENIAGFAGALCREDWDLPICLHVPPAKPERVRAAPRCRLH